MRRSRQYRLYTAILIILSVSLASGLVLYALRQNINLYWTPSQLTQKLQENNQGVYAHSFRLGGLVKKNSVHFNHHGLGVHFIIEDLAYQTPVFYQGILPTLFKEGRGVIVQGMLNKKGVFVAEEVLAKHDEKYTPPGLENKRS